MILGLKPDFTSKIYIAFYTGFTKPICPNPEHNMFLWFTRHLPPQSSGPSSTPDLHFGNIGVGARITIEDQITIPNKTKLILYSRGAPQNHQEDLRAQSNLFHLI